MAKDWSGYEEATTEDKHLILILKLEKVLSSYTKIVRHGPPKHSVPRELRRHYSRKKRASKKLYNFKKTSDVKFTNSLMEDIRKIDKDIKEFSYKSRLKEEALVFENAKKDSNAIYKFIKHKNRLSAMIGPIHQCLC